MTYTSKNEFFVIDVTKGLKKGVLLTQDDIGISTDGIDADEDLPSTSNSFSFSAANQASEPQKNPFVLTTSETFEINIAIQ